MTVLGVNEVLEEVGNLGIIILILALETSNEMLKRDIGDVGQVGRADALDGVLVKQEVKPRHLTDGSKADSRSVCVCWGSESNVLVKCLVGNLDGLVKVEALVHVTEAFAEGDGTIGIPRV